jgi:hypothetical protein
MRSRRAAEEIYAYNPRMQIIAMLRNPLDVLPSYHSYQLWYGLEDIEDFGGALSAESDRRDGRRIPPRNGSNPWFLLYRDVVRFHEQLERYFSVFGRERVHVVIFDDLVGRPAETYKRVLEFLDVDPAFTPEFTVVNPNKSNRSRGLKRAVDAALDPSSRVRRAGTRLIPIHAVRSAMGRHLERAVVRMNTRVAPRTPLDPQLRLRLARELAPEVDELSAMLARDLTGWYVPDRGHPRVLAS